MPRRRRLSSHGVDQMIARGADVVGSVADAEGGFGGDQNLVAIAAFDGFAENFFGEAVGVDVGGVEMKDAGIEADVLAQFSHRQFANIP